MDGSIRLWVVLLVAPIAAVLGQGQQCYYGAGAAKRAPAEVVPCSGDGTSACCLQGDTCFSGNVCYNFATGNLYQYGCTDVTYSDPSCPYKCGLDTDESPWVALEYCDEGGVDNTWVCHSPSSCGCSWSWNASLLVLKPRGCQAMGSEAKVALYAPTSLAPWVSLPSSVGGTTAYYSTYSSDGTWTWISTAIKGYTPDSIGPYTTYSAPDQAVVLFPGQTPDAATLGSAHGLSVTPTQPPISGQPSMSGSSSSPSTTSSPSTKTPPTTSTSQQTSTGTMTTSSASPSATGGSSSLTTGAKAGIGVGVAGGVIVIAAVALFFLISRRRKRRSQVSTGSGPDEKYASWQGQPYPPGGSPHGYHYNQGYQYQGVPAMIHEATYSPEDEQTIQKRLSPPQPLAEMEGGHVFPEADSRSPSRSRAYEDRDIAKRT